MASDVLQLGRRERGRRIPVERGVPVCAGGGALFKERVPPEVLDGPEPGPPSMEAPIHTSGHAEAPVALQAASHLVLTTYARRDASELRRALACVKVLETGPQMPRDAIGAAGAQ